MAEMSTRAGYVIEPAPEGSDRERDDRFYSLLAGGAKTRMLEAFMELDMPTVLGNEGAMTASEICRRFSLHPDRGWKFCRLLAMCGLLKEEGGARGEDEAVYSLSDDSVRFFGADGSRSYYFYELVHFWKLMAKWPTLEVLRGLPVPDAAHWPPPTPEAAAHIETWMRVTAEGAIRNIVNSGALEDVRRLLDVGGGDGTIGCSLVEQYPDLHATVFNLPASAYIARRIIHERSCSDRVDVCEGDFNTDEFPEGYDAIMFSRVLTDWSPAVCKMLFEKVRRALVPGGKLVINEAFVEGNMDYAISWEFRYVHYDTFGRRLFKEFAVYQGLLEEVGFEITKVTPMTDHAFYSVVEAVPVDRD